MSDVREAIRTIIYESDTDKLPDAVLAVVTAHMAVTDEDTLQILRGYWRDVGASFGEMEIKHMVELLEAFVASKLKAEPK